MESKSEITGKILKAAAESPEFRAELISNPKSTVEKLFGFKLPGNFEIVVREDTPAKIFLVLPAAGEDLTSDDLGKITGGNCLDDCHFCEAFG